MPVAPGNMFRDELELFADSVARGAPCELSTVNGIQALAAVLCRAQVGAGEQPCVPLSEIIEAARR
jgi:hypothetical protein